MTENGLSGYSAQGAGEPPVVRLLGGVAVHPPGVGGAAPVAGARPRTVLAALALRPGRFRGRSALIDDVWGERLPRDPVNALHTQISRLRSLLPEGVLEQGPAGYRLALSRSEVDLTRAEDLLKRAADVAVAGDGPGASGILGDVARLSQAADVEESDLPDGPVRTELGGRVRALARRRARVESAVRRLADAPGRGGGESAGGRDGEEDGAAGEDRGAGAAHPHATGLRAEPNLLLGRDGDVAEVRALLASARVVSILGPGGTGKTRLANRIGADEAAARRVAMVELAGVRSGEDVASAVAGALGLGEGEIRPDKVLAGSAPASQRPADACTRLRAHLAGAPMLLILDNCEQVIAECADLVADLVASCPQLTVLTTSRTPLAIAAEASYPLASLPADAPDAPAVRLFEARARAARPSVRLDPDVVAGLCTALDGLPLAIELAAARVRTLSVEQVAERLADRFALLRGGDRSAPERHRTLEAVIEWSWNLLSGDARATLRRMSLLPGGFGLDAARAIAGSAADGAGADGAGADGTGAGAAVEDAVADLADQSLLTVVEHPESGELRYSMLETVREFGARRLDEDPAERAEAARRFGRWAARFSTRAAHRLMAAVTADRLAAIEAEYDNLVAALRAALDGGAERDDAEAAGAAGDGPGEPAPDAATAVVLPVFAVLCWFLTVRGAHAEAGQWALRGEEHLHGDEAWPTDPAIDTDMVHLSALFMLVYRFFVGERRAAARWRTRVRRIARARPPVNRPLGLVVRLVLASSPMELGRILARGAHDDDPSVRLIAYSMRTNAHENSGRPAAARRDGLRALDLARATGSRWSEGMSAQELGQLAGQAGRYEDAVEYYRLAARILWEMRAHEESLQMRGFIAVALIGSGRIEDGRREVRDARAQLAAFSARSDPHAAAQYRAALQVALAEADLAGGDIAGGLERYRSGVYEAVGTPGGPGRDSTADPYTALLVAAATCAHAAAGDRAHSRELAGLIGGTVIPALVVGGAANPSSGRGGPIDLPMAGAALLALVAVELAEIEARAGAGTPGTGGPAASGPAARAERLAWELALAERVGARQDFPSMRLSRWTAAARRILGDDAVDDGLRRAAGCGGPERGRRLAAALERRRG